MNIETLRLAAAEGMDEWSRIRRHLHRHPELSFEEVETAAFISGQLRAWGIDHEQGIAGTGIVGVLEGREPGKRCVAVRAELDALPINEANDVPYKSAREGVMHACGHDVHMTCLLGLLRILSQHREAWVGRLKFMFQPGEEKHPGGGSLMIAEGVLQNPTVDAIFGLHVYPHLPAGVVGFRPGQYMASTDEIHIRIIGKGGHAALPHQTIDPISIAAQIITALQQVVSRKSNPVSPCVLSFGRIAGGTVNNVIPEFVELSGTLRAMDETWRTRAHGLIRNIVEGISTAFEAHAELDIPKGYPSLYNDPELTARAEAKAREYLGDTQVRLLSLRMTADDFAFYSHQVPGCYFRIGTSREEREFTASVHHPKFDIDERAMETAIGTLAWAVLGELQG
ncbi:MAG: amidohydrolase [Bacteroidetes bacterium]|nr:amidohydrolase [Bacteroidota bacterium]MBS1630228.1 amidohydrolase [Bacteroidota bacterium]